MHYMILTYSIFNYLIPQTHKHTCTHMLKIPLFLHLINHDTTPRHHQTVVTISNYNSVYHENSSVEKKTTDISCAVAFRTINF